MKQEDARRRALTYLKTCARVCKAWKGTALAILCRRVDLVIGFDSGHESVSGGESLTSSKWKGAVPVERLIKVTFSKKGALDPWVLESTHLGRLVHEVHIWRPPSDVQLTFDEDEDYPFTQSLKEQKYISPNQVEFASENLAPFITALHIHCKP
ncbi:hypothetical protein HDU76_013361 [Blyttiomyces sp. JEL0837]|nr:hypothetical protein HDU76_013361 [Blyttiomyces sp. JEL0837]